MNAQETIIQLKELKLRGMAAALEAVMTLPVQNRPTLELAIARMVEAEQQDRQDRKTEMYLKTADLDIPPCWKMSSVVLTVTSQRKTWLHSPTVPSSEDMRTCSSKGNVDAENPSWHVPWEDRRASWDTGRSI